MNGPVVTRGQRVAYTMSRFPKLTETFVLDEILELQRQGVQIEIFPLWKTHERVTHPEAAALSDRVHYLPFMSLAILRDMLYWLAVHPARLLGALYVLIWANRRSVRFLGGALVAFPKACTMARRLQALEVRHLHAHFASHPAAIAYVIGRLTGIAWSFTAHGSDLHREQSMLVEKVAAARFVVAISEYNRQFIADRVGPSLAAKVKVVHCGVDTRAFVPNEARAGCTQFVCIGTLHEVKGQRYLLEACACASLDDWHCHFVGDGPDRGRLERLAETLGIADRVTFHGACAREQVRAILSRMTVACAPSVPTADGRREGIPVALMEAAACGLPLVASRLSGIPELVVDDVTGLLAEPGDARSLARALTRVAAEPETRERLGRGARAKVEREFSLRGSAAALQALMLAETPAC